MKDGNSPGRKNKRRTIALKALQERIKTKLKVSKAEGFKEALSPQDELRMAKENTILTERIVSDEVARQTKTKRHGVRRRRTKDEKSQ